jgi:hypothetical protein
MFLIVSAIILSQCTSTRKVQTNMPLEIGKAYYQNWIAGIEGGGSGINLYIPITSNVNHIELDSVYFQNKVTKLELTNKKLAIGHFKTNPNQKKDIIMSNEPYAEYGNQVPGFDKKIPFELKGNQCVISYIERSKTKYFMIDSIIKKQLLAYPSRPHNKE